MLSFLKIFYVWKVDETRGRKPWEDPTLLTAVISFLATIVAKYWGVNLKPDEQAGIVTVLTFIARLASPHVGVRPQTVAEVKAGVPSATVTDPGACSDATQTAKVGLILNQQGNATDVSTDQGVTSERLTPGHE